MNYEQNFGVTAITENYIILLKRKYLLPMELSTELVEHLGEIRLKSIYGVYLLY